MKLAVTTLMLCVAALLALGMVMLYSASMTQVGGHYLVKQLAWCGVGLVGCVLAAALDYETLRRLAWPIYVLAVLLLALVLVPEIGLERGGARRWLGFEGVQFQPSELGKVALVIMLAWYGERNIRQMHRWKEGVLLPGLLIGTILGLILVEDRGTTILLAAVSGVMLIVCGVRWRHLLPPVLFGIVGISLLIWYDPSRIRRIFGWLYLEEQKEGAGYQAYQAMLALGAGGWHGLGLGNGRQKLGFVPEHHTDFIFSIIGEELGLVATSLVVLAFVLVVVSGVRIALRAREMFGFLLGCGLSFLIGFQAFINIGVVTSALPNKGLPLPFISYGGSNLVLMLCAVGVLLSIARHGRETPAVPANPFAAEGEPLPQPS